MISFITAMTFAGLSVLIVMNGAAAFYACIHPTSGLRPAKMQFENASVLLLSIVNVITYLLAFVYIGLHTQ